jgi:hypothetical protein
MRQDPDPDHADWVRRLRERARLDAEELVPAPQFDVYGVMAPPLQPAALAEAEQIDGHWKRIAVAYGDWADPAGPFLLVTTAATRQDAASPRTRTDLLRSIDRERNRIADHAGVDEEDPHEPPAYTRGKLLIGDVRVTGSLCRHGSLWAARLLTGGLTVTVVSRGVARSRVRLGVVTDLALYLQGRNEMLGRLSERHRQQPPLVLEPAEGVLAYRALADVVLASQARTSAAARAGREPRRRAGEGLAWRALWQRAVGEQARLSGIGAAEAGEVVTRVINHVSHLQEQAPWFTADPELRERAIEETLRHAALGEDVPSRLAQQAWANYWAQHSSPGMAEPAAGGFARLSAGEPLIRAWLRAWQDWAGRR